MTDYIRQYRRTRNPGAVWGDDPGVIAATVIGAAWNTSSNSPALTRIDINGQTITMARADFDSLSPWMNIRRCNLSDAGVVNAHYGDSGYSDTGSNGQVMVEIPAFYYKSSNVGSVISWWISNQPLTGFTLHPAFVVNSVTKAYIYMAAYEGYLASGSKLASISGVAPAVSASLPTFRGYAQNRGTGWEISDFNTVCAIQLLYLIEYANFDSQSQIGQGVVNASTAVNTGATASLGNASGMASGTNGLVSISYRGVENFWGNVWTWVDGININNYVPWVANNGFASDFFAPPYVNTGLTNGATDGYVINIGFGTGLNYGFLASDVTGGSSSTYLCDYYYHATGSMAAFFGGSWSNAAAAGAFDWSLSNAASAVYSSVGARVCCKP